MEYLPEISVVIPAFNGSMCLGKRLTRYVLRRLPIWQLFARTIAPRMTVLTS